MNRVNSSLSSSGTWPRSGKSLCRLSPDTLRPLPLLFRQALKRPLPLIARTPPKGTFDVPKSTEPSGTKAPLVGTTIGRMKIHVSCHYRTTMSRHTSRYSLSSMCRVGQRYSKNTSKYKYWDTLEKHPKY